MINRNQCSRVQNVPNIRHVYIYVFIRHSYVKCKHCIVHYKSSITPMVVTDHKRIVAFCAATSYGMVFTAHKHATFPTLNVAVFKKQFLITFHWRLLSSYLRYDILSFNTNSM